MLTYLHFLRTKVDVEYSDGLHLLLLLKSVMAHQPPNHFGFLFFGLFQQGAIHACIFHRLFFVFLNCIECRVYKSTICARTICRLSCIQSLAPCGAKNVSCFESLALVGREKTSPAATNMPISTASAYHGKYKFRGRSINMKQILIFKICQFVTCPALSSQFPLPGDQFFQGNYFFCFLGVLEEPGTCVAQLHAST